MATDRTVLVRLKAHVSDYNKAMASAAAATHLLNDKLRDVTSEIDTTNDRTAWLAQSVLGLGPAFVPLAAGAIPVVTGLATQMGVAALAAGTAALAFNGVGDGLKALNTYQLDPSVANFEKLSEAMRKLGPDGEHFVRFLDQVGPKFSELGMTARAGMFPGVEEGITHFITLLPQLNRIVRELSEGMGELASNAGEALAGPKFSAFFDYLESDAKPILMDMGRTLGGFAEGLANMFVAFGPLTRSFSTGFADMAQSFAAWSRGLEGNDSFQSFLNYVTESGPMALDFLGALVDALASIVTAAAPFGEILLPALTHVLGAVSALTASPLGPWFIGLAAAVGLYGRVMALASVTTGGFLSKATRMTRANAATALGFNRLGASAETAGKHVAVAGEKTAIAGRHAARANVGYTSQGKAMAGMALQAAALGVVLTGTADKMGLSNTATLGLIGSLAGPWGAAVGASAGAVLDWRNANDELDDSLKRLRASAGNVDFSAFNQQVANTQRQIDDLKTSKGFKDWLSDSVKISGAILSGKGTDQAAVIRNLQSNQNKSEARQDMSLRNKGAAAANAANDQQAARASAAFAANAALAANGFRLVNSAAGTAGQSVAAFTASMQSANDTLARKGSIDAYAASLLDAADAIKANGKTLEGNTRAGLANRAALRTIASGALEAGENMKSFSKRTLFLDKSRDDFIKMAQAMGASAGKARSMADAYGLVDRSARKSSKGVHEMRSQISSLKSKIVEAKAHGAKESTPFVKRLREEIRRLEHKIVKVEEKGATPSQLRIRKLQAEIRATRSKMVTMGENGATAAAARIRAMRNEINSLRDRTVHINYQGRRTGSAPAVGGHRTDTGADGGVVPKTGLPYADRHPYLLADGERIISNRYGQADEFADILQAINDRRFQRPIGYADGGRAGAQTTRVSVAAPNVTVGGAQFVVQLDGRDIGFVVDEKMADREDMAGMRGRTGR